MFDHISTNDLQNTLFTLHRSKSQFAIRNCHHDLYLQCITYSVISDRHTAHQTLDARTASVQCMVKFQFDTCKIPIKHLQSPVCVVIATCAFSNPKKKKVSLKENETKRENSSIKIKRETIYN